MNIIKGNIIKVIVISFFSLLILLFFSCSEYEYADCHPQVHLTIINTDTCEYIINFKDIHTGKSTIKIKDTLVNVNSNDTVTNLIDYYYKLTDLDFCYLPSLYIEYNSYLHIIITINKYAQIVNNFPYYPWDTTSAYKFPGDCTHKIYDTLTLPFVSE